MVENKYHRRRHRFRAPEKWGAAVAPRSPLGRSNTERVVVPPIKGVWDKDDLRFISNSNAYLNFETGVSHRMSFHLGFHYLHRPATAPATTAFGR